MPFHKRVAVSLLNKFKESLILILGIPAKILLFFLVLLIGRILKEKDHNDQEEPGWYLALYR
jgi:hypothetical protein